MNKIYKTILTVAAVAPAIALTGCIEEAFPTSGVSQEQVQEVSTAPDAYAQGMPAYMNTVFTVPGERHWDFGYPAQMYVRDALTGDMPVVASGYDHMTYWRENVYQGSEYIFGQFIWWYYYKLIQTANLTLGSIDPATESAHEKMLMGEAYAYRAMAYLDAARMYEYLPTDGTSEINEAGNNVLHLTVPIVTHDMDEAQARNNPRVSREKIFEFILSDLDKAEANITAEARKSKVMPDLACVYGLKARLYLWSAFGADANKDMAALAKAREYARKAIDTSGCTPLTGEEWTDPISGFNDISSHAWMWGMNFVQEDGAVLTGIINYTSWASNEYVNGYAAVGPNVMITKSLYDAISNDDVRKLCFVAPEGHPLAGKEKWINKAGMTSPIDGSPIVLPPYASLKIRPGHGEMNDNTVACAVGVPIMRVEEMYFIEAEAAAHANAAEGRTLIEDFIRKYRCPTFKILESATDIVGEIITQKRMEFFLEGLTFFDIKRLNMPVTRRYTGSNFYAACAFNTTTRPAWMNIVVVRQEENGNPAFIGWNNPDPSMCYADQIEPEEEE